MVVGQTLRSGSHRFIDLIDNNEELLRHLNKGYYLTYQQRKLGKGIFSYRCLSLLPDSHKSVFIILISSLISKVE